MNALCAAAFVAISAVTLAMVGLSDLRPIETRCRQLVPGSIIEVVNCPHTPAREQVAAGRGEQRLLSALLGPSAARPATN
ncbi:MAG TPA: hypothetical protein VGN82_19000 [Bosea sp. (in: a-proteobacteria)]|jgi:hypothetical protein|uniref:hypothetical protein n=1 Tax=Bosea sp. (in: a-proteobacteria) TaxID=1871050 RepID=UPI002E0D4A3A|nr:hypothetical protein [Bosea sp. (in: a-proteobacteria)]